MILTGPEIDAERQAGRITIEPFDPAQLNPNSYNYRLGPVLRVHRSHELDGRSTVRPLDEFTIPPAGALLLPGRIYLGTTVEAVGSTHYVPSLIGRSSLGRLGVFLQYSADMGNLGAKHCWTLEIEVVQPTLLYAGDRMGQFTFTATDGQIRLYDGHFGRISEATAPARPELLAASR
ncbi:deoxycytidine deaminase [Kitasatospora sp. NPDC057965]|uniref:dCTP deaminase n=1 Tax=Kitasatospora sp. NPDC057965 TaxID=3346291 RepID=UPI0036DC70E6